MVYHAVMERMRKHQKGEELDDFFSSLVTDKSGNENKLELGEVVSEISGKSNIIIRSPLIASSAFSLS